MSLATSTQTITTTASEVGDASVGSREALIFQNDAAGATVYFGGSDVTAATGIAREPGEHFAVTAGPRDHLPAEEWFAVTASGTSDIRVVESR